MNHEEKQEHTFLILFALIMFYVALKLPGILLFIGIYMVLMWEVKHDKLETR